MRVILAFQGSVWNFIIIIKHDGEKQMQTNSTLSIFNLYFVFDVCKDIWPDLEYTPPLVYTFLFRKKIQSYTEKDTKISYI